MKEWIVIVAAVILAVILANFIIGDTNSLKSDSTSIMTDVRTELQKVQP
ncbi:MAG: hypothetical protein N2376_08830 [Clostridia bacterium]|nr:hypothetical protein [Clostridia bacterium]